MALPIRPAPGPEGRLRWLAENVPAYRERFARLWREAKETLPRSLADRAVSFVGAVVAHVARGCPMAPREEARRLAICRDCPNIKAEGQTYTLCGCNITVKTGWALEKCLDKPPRR